MKPMPVAAVEAVDTVVAAVCVPEATTVAACEPPVCAAADTGLPEADMPLPEVGMALPGPDMPAVATDTVDTADTDIRSHVAWPGALPARRRWEPTATKTATTTAAAATTATATTSARTSISIDEIERGRRFVVRPRYRRIVNEAVSVAARRQGRRSSARANYFRTR